MQTWFISRNSAEMHQLTHSSDEWKTDGINHLEAFKKCVAGRDSKCWDLMWIYKSLKIFSVPNLYLLIVEGLVIRKKNKEKNCDSWLFFGLNLNFLPQRRSDLCWVFFCETLTSESGVVRRDQGRSYQSSLLKRTEQFALESWLRNVSKWSKKSCIMFRTCWEIYDAFWCCAGLVENLHWKSHLR